MEKRGWAPDGPWSAKGSGEDLQTNSSTVNSGHPEPRDNPAGRRTHARRRRLQAHVYIKYSVIR